MNIEDRRDSFYQYVDPWAWSVLLAAGLLLALVYLAMPYTAMAGYLYTGFSLVAGLVILFAAWRTPRPFRALAWGLLAAGVLSGTTGHLIWYWLDFRGLSPYPSIADFFYILTYPLFIAAIWVLGRNHDNTRGAFLDALIVGVAAGVLGWAFLIAPYVHDPEIGLLAILVASAYPVADLILLPLALWLLFQYGTQIPAHRFLLLGVLCHLAADVLYAHGNHAGWYEAGGYTDTLWLGAYAFFMAAVWHPSARLEPQIIMTGTSLSVRRLALLALVTLFVPVSILLFAGTDTELVRVGAIGAIVLFMLILLRMSGLIVQIQRQANALEDLARTDPLTGSANRRALSDELEREIARAERADTALCIAYLDLDHFKPFNDTRGHAAGDDLLREMVSAWSHILRPPDLVARVGGEEFVVLLSDTDLESAQSVVERLRSLVPYGQTCSAGIARYERGESTETFLKRADRALYQAKRNGRDQSRIAD